MSRSNYTDDGEHLDLWRANIERAIKGRRGQALLKELAVALLALTDKALTCDDMANPEDDSVCALGAVALHRATLAGKDRLTALKEIAEKFPEGCEAEELADDFDISSMLAREITYINDDMAPSAPGERYTYMLGWVLKNIKATS